MDHALVARGASTSLVKSRLSLATAKNARFRIMIEMEKDEIKHHVRQWYVAMGIDAGEESNQLRGADVRPSTSSSNMVMRGTTKRDDDEQGRQDVNGRRVQAVTTTTRCAAQCLNICGIDGRDNKVTSNEHPRETRQALKIYQHDNMKYVIDVDEWGISKELCSGLVDRVARNIVKKISTESPFPCGAVESEAARQDAEAASNEGTKTHVRIDAVKLFVCEVTDNNFEEESMRGRDLRKCGHLPGTRNSRRVRMGRREQLQSGPSTSPRSTKGRNGVLPENASVPGSTSPEVQGRDREDAGQG